MLSFITYKNAPEQLEIVADEVGINELISYLEGIKRDKDHMHLVIDTELDFYPIGKEEQNEVFFAKHVRLEYNDTEVWKLKKG
jgi:hypothetical protein